MRTPFAVRSRARVLRRLVLSRRRPLAALLVALAVLVSLRATVGPAPPTVQVPVATHDLAAGALLTEADVTMAAWPAPLAPSGSAPLDPGKLHHDQVLAAPVRRGEAITDVRLVGSALARAHQHLTVMPVRLPDPAVVDLLAVGDRIDLGAVDPETGLTSSLAGDVLVLAVPPSSEGDSSLTGRLVVVGVTPASADAVAGAALRAFITVSYTR